ncbi:DNA-directed RNA polymerase subunit beta [Striga asiatica]|uniref:DNA-directed RNA polymerase subunit beta n=1 Tax=Striga asiatica TaxID=4170 RepID=A0A5A7QV26_STRAF|nr:DNA-directed RNA polymerase subunit beta [Striga asiatica]
MSTSCLFMNFRGIVENCSFTNLTDFNGSTAGTSPFSNLSMNSETTRSAEAGESPTTTTFFLVFPSKMLKIASTSVFGRGKRKVGVRFDVGFHDGAREAGFSHDSAHARVVKDGEDELVEVDSDGNEATRRVEEVVVGSAGAGGGGSAVVGLGAFEGGGHGVGEVMAKRWAGPGAKCLGGN